MEYHSFLFYVLSLTLDQKRGFRLLTELYSFLHAIADTVVAYNVFKFPSPYGVSFILMIIRWKFVYLQEKEFPSPYRVSFILILGMMTISI